MTEARGTDEGEASALPLADIEPHRFLLRQPNPGQLLFKVVKVRYLIDMLQKNYLHFQRVDTYTDDTADGVRSWYRTVRAERWRAIGISACAANALRFQGSIFSRDYHRNIVSVEFRRCSEHRYTSQRNGEIADDCYTRGLCGGPMAGPLTIKHLMRQNAPSPTSCAPGLRPSVHIDTSTRSSDKDATYYRFS